MTDKKIQGIAGAEWLAGTGGQMTEAKYVCNEKTPK